ncbi:MAG: 50S ribosomal protein L19e [Candidatus Iainarchaeum sp.]|jgi:large subunit ribosomal protein L19e
MNAVKAKELAAKILKVGVGRIYLDPTQTSKIKEAMTKDDIRTLIAERVIKKKPQVSQSKGRTRVSKEAKAKGRGRGKGKRSASKKVRSEQRDRWINRVRSQRRTLKELKVKNSKEVKEIGYSKIYKRIKGGYFRGKRHLVEFVEGAKK